MAQERFVCGRGQEIHRVHCENIQADLLAPGPTFLPSNTTASLQELERMEQIAIGTSGQKTSRIGLGTWAIGGWMWGGADEAQSIATIRSAVERGVTLI